MNAPRSVDWAVKLKTNQPYSLRYFFFHDTFFSGLLIKRILQIADTDSRFREMKRNTIGVVFYSTPHHGSTLAKYSNQAKYMLFPSIEVQELDKGILKIL